MAQVGLLGLVQVGEQPPGALHAGLVLRGQAIQPGAELLLHQGQGGLIAEAGLPPVLTAAVQPLPQELGQALQAPGPVGEHRLPGREAAQLVFQVVHGLRPRRKGGDIELAGGDVAQAQPQRPGVGVHPADVVVFPLLQHGGVDEGAGGDDADDVPVHQPLGQGRVLGLLADGHLVALGDEAGDVALAGVVGHAAHGGALLRGLVPVPGGERQVQLPGDQLGVLVEHLIKIPQPEEEDGVGIPLLHLQVLAHHGGDLSHIGTAFR